MNSNDIHLDETEDDETKRMKYALKLMYRKDLEFLKSKTKMIGWPSISSINSSPSQLSFNRPNSAVPGELQNPSLNHNIRNVVKYLENQYYLPEPTSTSSLKNEETNEPKINNSDNAIMPPPSKNYVSRISKNRISGSFANTEKSKNDHHMSESDIFKTVEQSIAESSSKKIRSFSRWTIMLNKDEQLVVKGTVEKDMIARSKPISKKLSLTKIESINKMQYKLEGNLVDTTNALPLYVREKFINGFPDDWQNVVSIWKQYLASNRKSNFRWPTAASDSDHDDKLSDYEHSVSDESIASTQNNLKIETKVNNELKTNELLNDSNHVFNRGVELLGKEKLLAFAQMLGNRNVSQEYITRFRKMLISINSFAELKECQNLLTRFSEVETIGSSFDNSFNILPTSVSTPKNQSTVKNCAEDMTKRRKISDDEDDESCLGVPKIPSNIFKNNMIHRHPRRSRQTKRKFENDKELSFNIGDDVSIVTEYKLAMKNQKPKQTSKDNYLKDSGCHTLSHTAKKRRYSNDYSDDSSCTLFDPTVVGPKSEAESKPTIVSIKNVQVNLERLQADDIYKMKDVTSKAEEKERQNEENRLKSVEKRKSDMKNEARKRENKENEEVFQQERYDMKNEEREGKENERTAENKKIDMKNEEKERRYKENEKPADRKKNSMRSENNEESVEKKRHYGSMDNPKVLKSWKVNLIYDHRLENQCGLVLQGILLNEAGHVNSRKYQTQPLQRRISPKIVQTIKNEYFKLEDTILDLENVPECLHSKLKNGLPKNLPDLCKTWKQYEDKNKSNDFNNLSKLRRRESKCLEFWIASDENGSQKSLNTAKVITNSLPKKKSRKSNQNNKQNEENKKAETLPKRGRPRNSPICIYKKTSGRRDGDIQLSDDYSSV